MTFRSFAAFESLKYNLLFLSAGNSKTDKRAHSLKKVSDVSFHLGTSVNQSSPSLQRIFCTLSPGVHFFVSTVEQVNPLTTWMEGPTLLLKSHYVIGPLITLFCGVHFEAALSNTLCQFYSSIFF